MDFTVLKSTPSENGGFVTTIVHETEASEVAMNGVKIRKSGRTLTYYINTVDEYDEHDEIELDLDEFDIVPRPFTTRKGKLINLKWLHLKD